MRTKKPSWEDRAIEAVNSVSERKYDSDSVIRVYDDPYQGDGLIFPGKNFDLFIESGLSGEEISDNEPDVYGLSGFVEQVNKNRRFSIYYNASDLSFSANQINKKLIEKGLLRILRTYTEAENIGPIIDDVRKAFSQIKSTRHINGTLSFGFDSKEGLGAKILIENEQKRFIEFILYFEEANIVFSSSNSKNSEDMSLDSSSLKEVYRQIANFR